MTRVLLVEDQEIQARGLKLLLSLYGLQLDHAPTVAQALELIATRPPYLAVICDLLLPGPSGADVARALREDPARPFLIACSGSDMALDTARHFDAKVRKPISGADLVELITYRRRRRAA